MLVILGLLTGGILAGQSLIRASQLRSVSTELNRFTTAHYAFRDKYLQIPGDMNNATGFWGFADGGDGLGADCRNSVTTDRTTCNGNASGYADTVMEYYRYWQHLSNAGLIEGSYTGAPVQPPAASAYNSSRSVNIPAGKYQQLGYEVIYDATVFDPQAANYYQLGGAAHATALNWQGRAMIPEDAWNVDQKMDDGIPGRGRFKSYGPDGYATGCTTNPSTTGDAYNFTNVDIRCVMYWRI